MVANVDAMLVGILESRNDRFMNDVVSRLNGVSVEFVSLAAERAPFECRYRVLVDRLSFCHPFLKEVVKSLALSGTYVINNPFTASATNKILDIELGSRLGLTFPKTIVLPNRTVTEETDGSVTQPDLRRVAEELGFPCILKPFDGYAWEDVYVVRAAEELQNLYLSLSSRHVLLAQQLIKFESYFRVFCFDKRDVLFIKWIPKPLAMGQYLYCDPSSIGDIKEKLTTLTIQLNQALDLDVNVVEWCVDEQGQWWVIDAYNEVPEVIPEVLPPEYYSWIVDRFAACIRDKLNLGKRNRTPFVEP
jgi:hypothetical protein